MSSIAQPLPLRKSVSWTLLGNVVYAGCQWGMLIVLAKLGDPERLGRFALGLAVTAPVMMLAGLQIRTIQASDARGEYRFSDYLGLRLITTAMALAAIWGLAFCAGYRGETLCVILAMGLAKAIEAVSEVFYGLFQRHEQMDRIAKSMMLKGPLSLAALGLGVYLTGSVLCGVSALAAAWGLLLVTYDLPNGLSLLKSVQGSGFRVQHLPWNGYREVLRPEPRTPNPEPYKSRVQSKSRPALRLRLDRAALARLAWTGLPLGLVVGLNSLVANMPRYLLEWNWGERELGIFAALAIFVKCGFYVERALGQAALPRLSRLFTNGQTRQFNLLVSKLLGFGTAIGCAGILVALFVGREVLAVVYEPEYARYAAAFTWLMVAAAFSYVSGFLKAATDATRCFFLQLPLFASAAVVCAVAGLLLIPKYGLLGGAFSILIARMALAVGYAAVLPYAMARAWNGRG